MFGKFVFENVVDAHKPAKDGRPVEVVDSQDGGALVLVFDEGETYA
jgi:hypothetical protein